MGVWREKERVREYQYDHNLQKLEWERERERERDRERERKVGMREKESFFTPDLMIKILSAERTQCVEELSTQ